ncbi:ATP-dependent DNA helicase DinG [Hydrogenophaga sp. 2FB]|uniref:ATP-dependent DNA helicase DinG n=1 Tax=Hydrogenophaga sp. 2FB TaxID=2502187 RepID=UPI0010FA373C|nr:ATP-dependent DNA helicase DinG [Hydrogenophaga sp. 2FB]
MQNPANSSAQPVRPARSRLLAGSHALQDEMTTAVLLPNQRPVRQQAPRLPEPFNPEVESSASKSVDGIDEAALGRARKIMGSMYEQVKEKWPGFVARDGQNEMMEAALLTFLSCKEEKDETRGANLATLEAGTGTGKTVAYLLAAIAAHKVTGKGVVVSTATVALQEQLIERDLPRLSEVIGGIKFDILKGRGRYVCASKLENVAANTVGSLLFDDEDEAEAVQAGKNGGSELSGLALRLTAELHSKKWNGEVDSIPERVDSSDWRKLQADGATCTANKCSNYSSCAFFSARNRAKDIPIVVGNHALVLSLMSRNAKVLSPSEKLFVFDEAHHIPDIAADQFAANARLTASEKVFPRLKALFAKATKENSGTIQQQLAAMTGLLSSAADSVASLRMGIESADLFGSDERVFRFHQGQVSEDFLSLFESAKISTAAALSAARNVVSDLKRDDESISLGQKDERRKMATEIAMTAQRLDDASRVFDYMTRHDKVPLVKWIELVPSGRGIDFKVCASPLTPASGLVAGLWSKVAAAVCTSATITACGSFDYYDRLTGLNRMPERRRAIVASPFDYPTQGLLRVAPLTTTPKSSGWGAELNSILPRLLEDRSGGQLVLFTSRKQMQSSYDSLPAAVRAQVLIQGTGSRNEMLSEHARRVKAGQSSTLFGLQSLGEGIDLPGDLCVQVIIDKLPFTPPTTPVDAALAEWLESQGRDPFSEIAVPKASMKLAQWVGRGIRTVTDKAVITVCDTRLATSSYGRLIVDGLPPFPFEVMSAAGDFSNSRSESRSAAETRPQRKKMFA